MALYAYKNDTGIVVFSTTEQPTITVSGIEYTNITDITDMYSFIGSGCNFKQIRDSIKTKAISKGMVDTLGAGSWGTCTTQEQVICAELNIGNGAMQVAAIPDATIRIKNSVRYLVEMRGSGNGEAGYRAILVEAMFWACTKHILVPVGGGVFVEMPAAVINMIKTSASLSGISMGPNLLDLYRFYQLQGFAKGDQAVGIIDFIEETPGTIYAGAGLRTTFSWAVPDGYADIDEFADKLIDVFNNGDTV